MLIQKRFEHIVSFQLMHHLERDVFLIVSCLDHSAQCENLTSVSCFFHKKLMTIGTISGWKFSHTFPCLLSHKSLMSCSWEPSSFTRQNIEKNQRKVRKQIIFLNIKKQKHGKKLINFQLPAGQLQESPRLCMVPSFFAIQVCSILRPCKLILGFRGHSLHACSSCTS